MTRVFVLLLLLIITVPVLAQQEPQPSTPMPLPENPVVMPIPGLLAFSSMDGAALLDTATGKQRIFNAINGSPHWNPYTNNVLFLSNTIGSPDSNQGLLQLNGSTIQIVDLVTQQRNAVLTGQQDFAGWSADGQHFMRLVTSSVLDGNDVFQQTFTLERVNLQTQAVDHIVDFTQRMPMQQWFDIPSNTHNVVLDVVYRAQWNPVYSDWVFLQPIGYGKRMGSDEDIGIYDAGLFNLKTQQYISLSTLLPQTVISFTPWSSDGRKIAMNTMTGITILDFKVNGQEVDLKVNADSIDSADQAVRQWMNVGDLLMTGVTPGWSLSGNRAYVAYFVAQVIDNQWYYREFLARPAQSSSSVSFRFTGTPEEEAALSCIFWDEVYPPHLKAGARGRVTFTDGTPSRLRADHSAHAAVVTQMAEGTTFEVTQARRTAWITTVGGRCASMMARSGGQRKVTRPNIGSNPWSKVALR